MCFESLCSLITDSSWKNVDWKNTSLWEQFSACQSEIQSLLTFVNNYNVNNTHNWRGLTWINSHRKTLVIKPIKSYIFILLIEVTMVEASLIAFCFFPLPILWMRYVADSLKLVKHLIFFLQVLVLDGRWTEIPAPSLQAGWTEETNDCRRKGPNYRTCHWPSWWFGLLVH